MTDCKWCDAPLSLEPKTVHGYTTYVWCNPDGTQHLDCISKPPKCEHAGCKVRSNRLHSIYGPGYIMGVCDQHLAWHLADDPKCVENAHNFRYAER